MRCLMVVASPPPIRQHCNTAQITHNNQSSEHRCKSRSFRAGKRRATTKRRQSKKEKRGAPSDKISLLTSGRGHRTRSNYSPHRAMAACVHSSSTPEYGPRSTLSGAQTSGAIFGRFFGFARWDDESVQPFKNWGLTVRRKLQFKMRGARNEVSYPRKKEKKRKTGKRGRKLGERAWGRLRGEGRR